MKNPVFLALIATCVVFAVTYYYYNYYSRSNDNDKDDTQTKQNKQYKKKKNTKKGKDGIILNETIIVSSLVAGLIVWYAASSYFSNETTITKTNEIADIIGPSQSTSDIPVSRELMKGGGGGRSRVSRLDSDDSTRSYNLIGSGVNIPRSDLKIPSVLIDYKN